MRCSEFRDNLVTYLRNQMSVERKEQMKAHFSTCAKCHAELRKTEHVMNLTSLAVEEPVIRLVHTYIQRALKRGASDLHFEIRRKALTVRCRVDGVMVDLGDPAEVLVSESPEAASLSEDVDRMLAGAVLVRLQLMADVDPAQSDVPRAGRIRIRWEEQEYHLPAWFVPTAEGADAVFRIVTKVPPLTLEAMGISEQARASVQRMLDQPMGLILVGGPSGSGKTTLVMSLAQSLASPARKVVTVEDPVFARMENVTQVEVAEPRGLTTSALVPRVARLDPDIVAVHAIRDADVAVKCMNLALEGRLVIAAIHGDTAAEALWRFAHMPDDRNLAYSSLVGVTGQRLVRKICDDCREGYTPSPEALAALGLEPSGIRFERGAGCEKCRNTGYRGRTVIVEALEITRERLDQLKAISGPVEFRSWAENATSPTIVADGRQKVLDGVTTPEEICRVIPLPRA